MVPITCFPRRKKGFRGVSRRPWVPNRPSSEKNRQHHEGVQSVGLLLPTPSMNRLGALLCSSIQGSVSLQVLTNFKKKRDNFTVGRPRRYHLIHIIKVNITINKRINISYPNVMLWKGHNITSLIFLPKMHNLNLIMREIPKNPDWGTFYKITDQYSSKLSKSWKTGKNWGNVTLGDTPTKCSLGSWIWSLTRERKLVEKLLKSNNGNSITPLLIS